jgi:hypothetical protein
VSIAIYEGDFDDLSGGVVFSWFISNPRGPTALVRFVEVADITASARLRCDHPQKPGFGISRRDHPGAHPALRHAAAEPALYRRHARQEAGRPGRKESNCHRGAQPVGSKAVVEGEWLRPKSGASRKKQHGGSYGHRELAVARLGRRLR